MRLLVWQPVYVLGGGLEVLRRLVTALGRQPAIDTITLAVNRRYSAASLAPLMAGRGLATVRIDADTPLAAHAPGHDAAWIPWPHGTPHSSAPLPKVCVFQDTILLDALGGHATREFLEGMARGVRETVAAHDRVIVTSNYTRRRMLEIVGSDHADRIAVLPHLATASSHDETATAGSAPAPAALPWGVQPPFLLYPANASEHKNHETLLLALARRRRRDVPVLFCGYGTEQIGGAGLVEQAHLNRINRLIRDRGLVAGRDFRSLGYVDDATAATLLRQATALVMPTRAEGMGLPIHEAIDAGVPVIASDIEVLREHYDGRSRAIRWIDPECPAEIAAALDDACDHAGELRAAAQDNRGSGRTWDDVAAATVAILQEVVADYDPWSEPRAEPGAAAPLPARRRWLGTGRFRGLRRFLKRFGRGRP
jgi:glycosyltransferase involved in cell wall biosynthesis